MRGRRTASWAVTGIFVIALFFGVRYFAERREAPHTAAEVQSSQVTPSPSVSQLPQRTVSPTETPTPSTPQPSKIPQGRADEIENECEISVRCDTILENIGRLNRDKTDILPQDGVIFPKARVAFDEGESAFDVLQREMKKAGIPLEFVKAPVYGSAYIEGIANLYETDCGELSGWMYRVNGEFPGYGASKYTVKRGDKIEWLYTCDLGRDLGNEGGWQY